MTHSFGGINADCSVVSRSVLLIAMLACGSQESETRPAADVPLPTNQSSGALSQSDIDSAQARNPDPLLRRALDSAVAAYPRNELHSRSDKEIEWAWHLATSTSSGTRVHAKWSSAVIAEIRRRGLRPWDTAIGPSLPSTPSQSLGKSADKLPAYNVLERVSVSGSVDVLVPSLRPSLPDAKLEPVARAIAAREGAKSLAMYRTREAFRANYDGPYSDRHPGIVESGYLGTLRNGTWEPPVR